jgi:hypothetical protein
MRCLFASRKYARAVATALRAVHIESQIIRTPHGDVAAMNARSQPQYQAMGEGTKSNKFVTRLCLEAGYVSRTTGARNVSNGCNRQLQQRRLL